MVNYKPFVRMGREKEYALKPNREYKDSMFKVVLGEKENFRQLYNALKGTNYGEETEMEDATLKDALVMDQINDVSFVIDGKLVVLIEHQSSINNNMPLRMLMYAGRIYEMITDSENLYNIKMIDIPRPEFYVFYNGEKNFPKKKRLRLSDMYKPVADGKKHLPKLELVVDIYNINSGCNPRLLKECQVLGEYETLMELIQKYRDETGDLKKAITMAVAECKKRKILVKYLTIYAAEVENMLFTQFNIEDAQRVWLEDGIEIGMERERLEIARNLLARGMSVDEVASATNLTVDDVLRL